METTLTMAGQMAPAGVARVRALAPASGCRPVAARAGIYGAIAQHQVLGSHPSATWTKGATAKPATVMVFHLRKNRPTRPLLEHSP